MHSKVKDIGRHTQQHKTRHTQQGDLISLVLFFQNKESRLKIQLAQILYSEKVNCQVKSDAPTEEVTKLQRTRPMIQLSDDET
jgi:hypothetical protein